MYWSGVSLGERGREGGREGGKEGGRKRGKQRRMWEEKKKVKMGNRMEE